MSTSTAEAAPDRRKRARSPGTVGRGDGSSGSCADSADLELEPLRRAKRTSRTAQSAPCTIANDCMDPLVQAPAPSCPLTVNYGVEDGKSRSLRGEDEPEAWLDADERAILELMNNLEQAIRKDEEDAEDSASSSSNSPSRTCSTAATSRLRGGDEEDGEGRTSLESDCSCNLPAGDEGAVVSTDGEIHQWLLRAEGLDFPANLCDNWGTFMGSSQDYVITSSLEPYVYDDEWGDNVCYNPLLDPIF